VHGGGEAALFFFGEGENVRVGDGVAAGGDDVEGVVDDVVVARGGADRGFGDVFCEVEVGVFDGRVFFGWGFAVWLRVCDGWRGGFGRVGVVGEEGNGDAGEG